MAESADDDRIGCDDERRWPFLFSTSSVRPPVTWDMSRSHSCSGSFGLTVQQSSAPSSLLSELLLPPTRFNASDPSVVAAVAALRRDGVTGGECPLSDELSQASVSGSVGSVHDDVPSPSRSEGQREWSLHPGSDSDMLQC